MVRLGDATVKLPPSYTAESVVSVVAPAGVSELEVRYTFDDGYRTGTGKIPGPSALFRLPLSPATSLTWSWTGAIVDAAVFALIALLVWFYAALLRPDAWWFLGLALAAVPIYWPARFKAHEAAVIFAIVPVLMLRLAECHRTRGFLRACFSVTLLGLFRRSLGSPDLHAVLPRSAGQDWLTYESFGRTMLDT
jgi:hypothetical protein